MNITNNLSEDLAFNIDVDMAIKGVQSRVVIRPAATASIAPDLMLLLMLNHDFQAAITNHDITIGYTAADVTFYTNIGKLIAGTL